MTTATLNGHRVTHARVSIPAWGCWFADVSIDGEESLTGTVDVRVSDLALRGTIISGGAAGNGRSHFRIAGGAAGWGKTIAPISEVSELGVRLATVLNKAAEAVGETIDLGSRASETIGPRFVSPEQPASRVLNQLADRSWYVDESGITRLGSRATSVLDVRVAAGPVDRAGNVVTFSAESIASVLPGVTYDGLEVVDVEHELSPDGLRTTVWGRIVDGDTTRRLEAWRRLSSALDPTRDFRGVHEFRIGQIEEKTLGLQPVRASSGMPDIRRVPVWPGVSGIDARPQLGARVLVAFADANPFRPVVVAFEDVDASRFVPSSMNILADGMVGGEHVMTTEATALLIYNFMVALMAAAGGGPLVAAVLQPLLGAAMNVALAAQSVPSPPGLAAQIAASAAQLAGFATGVAPATTSQFFAAAIAAAANKTPNDSGFFPSIGSRAVKTG